MQYNPSLIIDMKSRWSGYGQFFGIKTYISNLLPFLLKTFNVILVPPFTTKKIPRHLLNFVNDWLYLKYKSWKLNGLWFFPSFPKTFFPPSPFVVTIHDIIPLTHTQFTAYRSSTTLSYKLYYGLIKQVALKATHIITVSNFSKKAIVELLQVIPEKITVIYNGFSPPPKINISENYFRHLGIRKPYFLFVARDEPYKNPFVVYKAYSHFKYNREVQLVVAGKVTKYFKQLDPFSDLKIVLLGIVSRELLYALYANAYAFIFPSIVEGFGLPPLEAMSLGTPVISSSAMPMPEILQNAALYFDPFDAVDLANKMQLILENTSLHNHLSELGKEHSLNFTWEKSAKQHINLFSSLL